MIFFVIVDLEPTTTAASTETPSSSSIAASTSSARHVPPTASATTIAVTPAPPTSTAASAPAKSRPDHGLKLGRHILFCLGKNLYKLRRSLTILVAEESMSDTLGTGTASTPNSVDVVLNGIHAGGHIVIDDDSNVLHIKTTSSNISGDEQSQGSVLEGTDDLGTLPLSSISMERIDGKAFVPELIRKLMASNLFGDKNNALGMLLTAKINRSPTARGGTVFFLALLLTLVNELT